MLVHFTSSSKNIRQRKNALLQLSATITESGHKLSRDWLKEAVHANKKSRADLDRWKKISKDTIEALQKSDAVIIEATIDSFSMGFQTALAISLKKPLLIIRSSDVTSDDYVDVHSLEKPVEQSLLAGISTSLKTIEVYESTEQAVEMIRAFLAENDIKKKDMRFDMYLDRESYQYLKKVSDSTGKTKAQVIRDILKEKSRR